jgi:hypothetical protein
MKILLLTFSLCVLAINTAKGQSKHCGTDEAVKKQLTENPELQLIRDSINTNRYSSLDKNSQVELESIRSYELPKLPGYSASGDFQLDLINWQKAKKELFEANPELYKELTRKSNGKTKKPKE